MASVWEWLTVDLWGWLSTGVASVYAGNATLVWVTVAVLAVVLVSFLPDRVTRWLRHRLFSTWYNVVFTIVIVWGLVEAVPSLYRWLIPDATVINDSALCREIAGACWGFVVEKHRFILFGTYTYDEQWRPALAVVLLVVMLAASTRRWFWAKWDNRLPVRAIGWAVFVLAILLQPVVNAPGAWDGFVTQAERGLRAWQMLVEGWIERPLTAIGGILGLVIIAAILAAAVTLPLRRRLATMWVPGLIAIGILMHGGVFGLRVVPTRLWGGLPLNLGLSVFGLAIAFPLGIVMALGRRSAMPAVRSLSILYIEFVRGVPLITVFFMSAFLLPLFLPTGVNFDNLLRAQVAVTLFAAAYLAEVVRGGLQAVPRGQYEAADSLGLTYWQKMRMVVLPQALKISIPPLVNSSISTFKDTSLVVIIGLYDLVGGVKASLNDGEWRGFFTEGYLFVGAIFFVFCFSLSRYSQRLEKQVNVGRRR